MKQGQKKFCMRGFLCYRENLKPRPIQCALEESLYLFFPSCNDSHLGSAWIDLLNVHARKCVCKSTWKN